jgi:hypothetical protein
MLSMILVPRGIAVYRSTLTGGMRLGPYEILAPIGAGGMGEVYPSAHRIDPS